MDTLTETVPPPPPGDEPPGESGPGDIEGRPRRRLKKRWYFLGGFVFLVVAAVVSAALIRVPYFLLSPGSVRDTQKVIRVDDARSFDNPGEIAFATVSLQRATALGAALGWLDDSVDVVDEDKILGGQSEKQNRQENMRDMTDSKQVATAVALKRLGYDVTTTGTGAAVVAVAQSTPAEGLLNPGDVVVGADHNEVHLAEDLVAAIGSHKPGEQIELEVQRAGEGATKRILVVLASRPNEPDKALLGVSSVTRDLQFHFPIDVSIDSGDVSGPSAGLAFTLGVMDRLVPQSLTGGLKVATTGTIDTRGNVGPVGGVQQKTIAVRRAGVDLFLVPRSEYDEAKKYAGDMRVEPVDTLDDALKVLATVGGGTTVMPHG